MQKNLNIVIVILIIVLLTLLGYYLYINKSQNLKQEIKIDKKQPPAPSLSVNREFNFKTITGKNYHIKASEKIMQIEEAKEKLVFLKIFGWDCEFCIKEIPELVKLKKDLGDTFDIVAIEAQQHNREDTLKYIKQYGINYSIIDGNEQKEFYEYLKTYYGWNGVIPLTIVLGKGGKILAYEIGAKSYTLAELMKASLLKDKGNN